MEIRESGNSGLKLSVVGFGCWQLGQKGELDYWGTEVTQATANALVKQAHDAGVRTQQRPPFERTCRIPLGLSYITNNTHVAMVHGDHHLHAGHIFRHC